MIFPTEKSKHRKFIGSVDIRKLHVTFLHTCCALISIDKTLRKSLAPLKIYLMNFCSKLGIFKADIKT